MKKIDLNTYKRRELYNFFKDVNQPFYSITLPIDITNVKEYCSNNKLSFYYTMIYLITTAINKVDAFKIKIIDNELYLSNNLNPSFTALRKNEENFFIVTTEYNSNLLEFNKKCSDIVNTQTTLFSNTTITNEVIYFSCLPWFNFTSLTNERNFDVNDTIPRIAWGKYYKENNKLLINLSLELNHKTVDGYHISLFKNELDNLIKNIKEA